MVQLTLAYISKRASIRFEYAYGEKVGDNPENQVKLIYFNIVNDIISKLGHVTKNYVAAESIIDKKYKSKINLMDIVAVDAYKKLFGTTDPVMTAIFRDFIEKLPYKNRQSVINISNIFWRQRTSKIGEGMFCDISSAVRNESGDIQIAYIMCYSSEDLIEQDILFLDYYYNNVYVKMNGFGLIMQKDKWVAEKQKIIDQLKHDMVKVESIELGDDELGVIA
ncbi:hypothetical protein B0G81_7837 [Paraburkholderia sp. BL6665CI2N2]|nr:hypothetical protein B0G81_7837 [Paraburkholderia sp. BL6665CI2N2]